jgi:carboxypeptidase PM20D1
VGPVKGGHSSAPPDHTAVGLLARAIAAVETHPLPLRLQGPGRLMLEALAPELPWWARVPLTNLWLFAPVLERLLWHESTLRVFFWTTQAVTVVQARPRRGRQCRVCGADE